MQAQRREGTITQAVRRAAEQPDFSAGGEVDSSHEVEESRFAASRRPHNGDKLTGANDQVYPADGWHHRAIEMIGADCFIDLNNRFGHASLDLPVQCHRNVEVPGDPRRVRGAYGGSPY